MLQEIPPAIVFLVADPDFEVLIDPGSGVQLLESLGRRRGLHGVTHGVQGHTNAIAQLEPIRFEGAKEQGEKPFAAVVVMLPGIFAVEDHRNGSVVQPDIIGQAADPPEHVVRGGLRSRFVVDEPECVGDVPITEHHGEGVCLGPDRIGLVEMIVAVPPLASHLQRAIEDALIRGQPADAGLCHDR